MAPKSNPAPLVAIVGQTATGKSAMAIDIAKKYNGEIIAADSRTVYKFLDIGTAKPSSKERSEVPHHLIDVVAPNEQFTAAQFVTYARQATHEIRERGRLPIIVGGTGLYIDALLYGYSFRPMVDPGVRAELERLSVDQLQARINERNLPMPVNNKNPRHLIRTLETDGAKPQRTSLSSHTLLLGLELDRDVLRTRISSRVDAMVSEGFIDEVRMAADTWGWDAPALQAPGYRAFRGYLEGTISLDEAKAAFIQNDMQLAKRQHTWFKRNKDIIWISNLDEAVDVITTLLNN